MTSDPVTIYHNPRCSKSRATLGLIHDAGLDPEIILYLEAPPSAQQLRQLLHAMDISARELMRTGEAVYKELGLSDKALSEEDLIEHMAANPILIERPIVVAGDVARLCRPPELVSEVISSR